MTRNDPTLHPGARWRRRKADRPSEIAAAALRCFAERGFAACRLDDIAKRAGVTKGTLYLYFPSKEELFKEVVRQAIVPRIKEFERLVEGSTEPAPRQLERFVMAWPSVIAAPDLGAIPKLVIAEAGNFPDLARFYFDEVISRGRRLITGVLRRGVERGEFRPIDPKVAFFSVIAPLLVAVLWRHTFAHHDTWGLDAEALCRSHVSLLLRGLQPSEDKA